MAAKAHEACGIRQYEGIHDDGHTAVNRYRFDRGLGIG